MKYEFFPVSWTKSNTKPPKLPKALKGLTISQLTMILDIFQKGNYIVYK